ncbi:MAG: tRNA 2-thiouridine(34) synthase MnmA, partial [Actinobacteria bacterium]|nr:tRNA 2-thiouridine(34) synthase MnmA [Actinomycetota bacterium]
YIATGHYAKIQKEGPDYFLMKSRDKTKDQSYFLYSIEKEKLPGILFPLADHTKAEVRKIAKESGLPVAEKAESQEVCFVPDDDYRKFIRENAPARSSVPGNIVDFEGNIIGKHEGIEFFTVGQRKGLRISSAAPLYVIKIDACKNEITAGERRYLKSRSLIAGCINILAGGLPSRATAKIRYNHRKAPCELKILKDIDTGSIDRKKTGPGSSNDFKIEVIFDEPQESVTPGQSVVFYDSDTVLGGGIIESSRSS